MIVTLIDAFGLVVAAACAALLFRAGNRRSSPIVFWTGVCFAWLALNSVLAVADAASDVDLALARGATGAIGVGTLLVVLVVTRR